MEGIRPLHGQRYPYYLIKRLLIWRNGWLDLQIPKPLFWHHPIITYSSPMAWMQPVGHNIERKIVDYWSTAELNPVESKVFILKSFLWNRIRIWTGLCLEFMDCLLILQLFESKMILAPFLKIFGNIYKPEIIFGSFHDKITSLNFLMGLPVIILCSFSLESLS